MDEYIFCRYITKNGKRIYPKKSQFFKIPIANLKKNKMTFKAVEQ